MELKKILNFKKENIGKYILNTSKVLLGNLLLALAVELFYLPGGIDAGGVTGIGVIFDYAGSSFNTELLITIITWTLWVLGLIFLGIGFSLQTLVSTISFPIFIFLINYLVKFAPWLVISNAESLGSLVGNDAFVGLLSGLFGGLFIGLGCSLAFLGGGSTGGLDVPALILTKFVKRLKSSVSIFIFDAIVILIGFIFKKDIVLCLEGILAAMITAITIDKILTGSNKMYVAFIVSDKCDEITEEIRNRVDRTTTFIDVIGGYSKEPKKMIMVSFSMRQYNDVYGAVLKCDDKAFMTVSPAHEINGEGFKPLKKEKTTIFEKEENKK